jgi:hypothetical protein
MPFAAPARAAIHTCTPVHLTCTCNMHLHLHLHMHMHMHMHMHTCVHIHMRMRTHTHMHMHVHVHMQVCNITTAPTRLPSPWPRVYGVQAVRLHKTSWL